MATAKLTTTAGGVNVVKAPGHGVVVEEIFWEHYAQRVEDIDMPNLDEGNFLAGTLGAFASTGLSLVGVWLGTTNASPWLYAVLGMACLTAGLLSLYFLRQYTTAKTTMKKTGATICREMREVAASQKARAGRTP